MFCSLMHLISPRTFNYNLRSFGEAPEVEPGAEVIIIVEEHILENHCESNIMASMFKL